MNHDELLFIDDFVQEYWQKCKKRRNELLTVMADEIINGASAMDHIYPYSEMPEVSCDFAGDRDVREAKSRCCKASIFRDGDLLICDRCRLVTKPIGPETSV